MNTSPTADVSPQKKVQVHIYRWDMGKEAPVFLLLRRGPQRNFIWQPVTGKVEPGESFDEAALREVEEETGICAVRDLASVGECQFVKDGMQVREMVFACEVSPSQVALSPEHVECAWLSAQEAFERLFYETNRQGLKLVMEAIQRHES